MWNRFSSHHGERGGVPGVIRGHEAVGTVIETGSSVDRVKVGDRVVIDPNQSCEKCYFFA
ncbi:alcohol dehydrogenase catalytic domain-containing protein [Paenibacillus rhizoplanae]